MAPTRREFLKMAGAAAAGIILPPWASPAGAAMPNAATAPLSARRWAMTVDTGIVCPQGCRDCIDACHIVHNVPDFKNPKDDVHWISQEKVGHIFPAEDHPRLPEKIQGLSLTVLCNHCENPPCVRVCPTKATFKRPDGIVMMDYHRCIGCRFCMAACPYGARSMNWRDPRPAIPKINADYPTRTRGVVEKCTFCEERLAKGIGPACVLACKEKVLAFGDLEEGGSDVRRLLAARFSLRRKANLGTGPQVYYLL